MKKVIAIILVLMSLFSFAAAEEYPKAAVVVCLGLSNTSEVFVRVEDGEGMLWYLDWDLVRDGNIAQGEVIAMRMEDNNTESIYDDEIVDFVNAHFFAQ